MKKKILFRVLSAVGMCIVVAGALALTSVLNMFRAAFIPVSPSETLASASSVEDTDISATWDQLLEQINEDYGIDPDLTQKEPAEEKDVSSEESVSSEVSSEAASESTSASSSSTTAASSKNTETIPAQAASSSESASSHTAASSSSSHAQDPCDAQLAQYVLQMEKLQKRSQSQLYSLICEAYDEYMSYPDEKHTLSLKVSIVLSKGSKLTSLQNACDKEFNAILAQMRTCLKENGRDQKLADTAQQSYEQSKSAMIKELTDVVYNTAVGNGTGGKWIEDHRTMA